MLTRVLNRIDFISEWSGRIASCLALVLIFAITYDVGMRYLFSAPTNWSYDLSYMFGGSLMILGGAYTLLHEGHIKVDVVYARLPAKARLIIDVTLTLLFFFPLMFIYLHYSINAAWVSWVGKEFSRVGIWEPIMWPFRCVFPIGVFLFLLQGIAWFTRNLLSLVRGKTHD